MTEYVSAEQEIHTRLFDLVSEGEWTLDQRLYAFAKVLQDIHFLLQPLPRSAVTPFGRGKGKGKEGRGRGGQPPPS